MTCDLVKFAKYEMNVQDLYKIVEYAGTFYIPVMSNKVLSSQ